MKTSWTARARALLFPPAVHDDRAADRCVHERFAIPYTFKPQLSLAEAFIAATVALLRIFVGSLLFAVCGTYTLVAWSNIQSLFLRVAAVLSLVLLFLVSLFLLMLASSALTRIYSPRRR